MSKYKLKFSIGSVYRFKSSCKPVNGDSGPFENQLLINKPSSVDIGIAIKKIIYNKSLFTFATQYGLTQWSESNNFINSDYNKYSFGIEWNFSDKTIKFPTSRMALRAGYSFSKPTNNFEHWPEVKGISFGLGLGLLILEEKAFLGLDISFENKLFDYPYYEKERHSLISIALTLTAKNL